MPEFLHAGRDFNELFEIVANQRKINRVLVEKDCWIMHCLWGGCGTIARFSEDIDIRIEPPTIYWLRWAATKINLRAPITQGLLRVGRTDPH